MTGTSINRAAASVEPSFLRRSLQLIGCSLGIYATFLGYGIIQERMYSHEYGESKAKFTFSLFLVFFQCVGNAAFAVALAIFIWFRSSTPILASPVPASAYFMMSATYIGAMFSSNLALGFMSYPAQALAKSCKLIPVMLSRVILMKDITFTKREVAQVLLITGGIGVFMIGGSKSASAKETSWLGLGLCILSLALDGYTGPAQEKLNREYSLSMSTMMFYLNAWAILIVAVGLFVTGEMFTAIAFCVEHPEIIPEATLFSLLAASGQALILYTLMEFNSMVVVTVTTTRKFFTILLSVVLYGHSLNLSQWSGVALVFIGLSFDVYTKYTERNNKKKPHHAGAKVTPPAVELTNGSASAKQK